MSIATSQDMPTSIARHFHDILTSSEQRAEPYLLPLSLSTRTERIAYARHIKTRMAKLEWPATLPGRIGHGQKLRQQILKALNELSKKPSSELKITRAQAMRLAQLVLFCNRDQDWACPNGPTIGASSAVLARYLGVNDVNEAMSPLLKAGLVALWNPQGNGKRWFQVINTDSHNEMACGSGWTLAPLIVHLQTIQQAIKRDQMRLDQRERLCRETRAIIAAARDRLENLAEPYRTDLVAQLDKVASAYHNARKGALTRLEESRHYADTIYSDIERIEASLCPLPREEVAGIGHGMITSESYTTSQPENLSTGCPARENGKRNAPSPGCQGRITPQAKLAGTAPQREVLNPEEAPTLFPNMAQLCDLTAIERPELNATLARLCGVSRMGAMRCEQAMGRLPTSLVLLIIGERLAAGAIAGSPDAYLAGMVKKHASGTLNLSYSVRHLRKMNLGARLDHARGH